MKLNWRQFLNFSFLLELFLYAFSLFLAIGTALNLAVKATSQQPQGGTYSAFSFIILFVIATAILLIILKYFKYSWLIQGIFYLAILEGLLIFTQAYFAWPQFLYVLAIIVFFWAIYQNVLMHNFVLVLSVSAISVFFGFKVMPGTAIIILLALAIYDFWAVYKTKHMIKMFKGLAEEKVNFSLIIPHSFQGLFKKIKEVSPTTEFMFLGTGDMAIPAIFVVSALRISLLTSLLTALGAVLGFVLLYVIFVSQKDREPMPGLPPLVLGALFGYLISFLI